MKALALTLAMMVPAQVIADASPASSVPGLPAAPIVSDIQMDDEPMPARGNVLRPVTSGGAIQTTVAAATLQAAAAPSSAELAALQQMVGAAQLKVSADIPPPASNLSLVPGKNELIPVARGHMNRLITPFGDAVIKTSSEELIEKEGSLIYVAPEGDAPITLYVMERGVPEQAMSITLIPRSIPPVEVTLTLEGVEPRRPSSAAKAAEWETSQPYVVTMKSLFRELAAGRVPEGYGLEEITTRGHQLLPFCEMPGFDVHPLQVLEGGNLVVFVMRAVNATIDPVEIDEAGCAAPGVLGVAAWPDTLVEAGYETELFVAVQRPAADESAPERPTVLRTARR